MSVSVSGTLFFFCFVNLRDFQAFYDLIKNLQMILLEFLFPVLRFSLAVVCFDNI